MGFLKKQLYMLFFCSLFLLHPKLIPAEPSYQHLPLNDTETWEMKQLKKKTDFSVTFESGEPVLTLESNQSAGIFYRMIEIDLNKTPFLNWSWKINHVFRNEAEQKRSGDDFPARLLVVYGEGLIGPQTSGFSFVWSSTVAKGTTWESPISENLMMVATQSGQALVKRWLKEKVDLKAAFKDLLRKDVDSVNYIALMADTDDLAESATTQFKDIYFSSE